MSSYNMCICVYTHFSWTFLRFFLIVWSIYFLWTKVYGAFRVAVKMLLMWNSRIQIDDGGNTIDTTSVLEVRNLAVIRVSPLNFISNTIYRYLYKYVFGVGSSKLQTLWPSVIVLFFGRKTLSLVQIRT